MNIIAYNTAYSLYPRSTYENRRALLMRTPAPSDRHYQAIKKYEKRGWKMIQSCSECLHSGQNDLSAFGEMERYIGDKYTWTIPLTVDGVQVPDYMMTKDENGTQAPGSALCVNSWKLVSGRCPLDRFDFDCRPLATTKDTAQFISFNGLKFVYMILPEMHKYVGPALKDATGPKKL